MPEVFSISGADTGAGAVSNVKPSLKGTAVVAGATALAAATGLFLAFKGPSRGRVHGAFGAAVSRQHFVAIAGLLCNHGAGPPLVDAFARYFASQNPNFQTERFKHAALSCIAARRAA